jgi:hypothetical protein
MTPDPKSDTCPKCGIASVYYRDAGKVVRYNCGTSEYQPKPKVNYAGGFFIGRHCLENQLAQAEQARDEARGIVRELTKSLNEACNTIEQERQARDLAQAEAAAMLDVLRQVRSLTPKFEYGGSMQDPCGVHAIVENHSTATRPPLSNETTEKATAEWSKT